MVPVQKITLVDKGQDFTTWFVRNNIVIDCQPSQGNVWVGTLILAGLTVNPNAPAAATGTTDIQAGTLLGVMPRATGVPTTLNYPVEAVELLESEQILIVEANAQRWAEQLSLPLAQLGL